MTVKENFHSISDLKHDPELARELGEMLVTWASAETSLMMALKALGIVTTRQATATVV